jgi:predicted Zn-dependent peptidase
MGDPLQDHVETIKVDTLANGVRVATDHMPSLASAAVSVSVGVGARHERADQNGIAHFLEHMAFKGTKTRSALKIAEEIEDVGGEMNAYTCREMTVYYARILAEHTGLALALLADILRNATMPEKDLEVERGVILQEIGQAADTPDDIVFDWAQARAFPNQSIGRPILGPVANIKRFGRRELMAFVQDAYTPDRIVVAAAGLVDHDEIVALTEKLFGDLKPKATDTLENAQYNGGDLRVEKDLEQAHIILGLKGPGYRDDDFYDSQIAATVLSGGMSSRLFQEVREKRGLCYTIFAAPSHYRETGWTSIYAGASGEQLQDLLEVTIDELKRASDDASDAEVARARAQIRAGVLMSLESPTARCQRIARGLIAHGRIRTIAELNASINAVDARSVRRFLKKQLTSTPTVTLYGPIATAPNYEALCSRLNA